MAQKDCYQKKLEDIEEYLREQEEDLRSHSLSEGTACLLSCVRNALEKITKAKERSIAQHAEQMEVLKEERDNRFFLPKAFKETVVLVDQALEDNFKMTVVFWNSCIEKYREHLEGIQDPLY